MSSQQIHKSFDKAWYYGSRGYLHKFLSAFKKSSRDDILALPDAFILYDREEIALKDGTNTREVRLAWHSAILDCIADFEAAEQLRQRVAEHHLLSESLNISPEYWHEGWKTGEVLRYTPGHDSVKHKIHTHISRESGETGLPPQQMQALVYLDLSRQITRHILRTAFSMGYDGLIGASPDSQGYFLAAFNDRAVKFHS